MQLEGVVQTAPIKPVQSVETNNKEIKSHLEEKHKQEHSGKKVLSEKEVIDVIEKANKELSTRYTNLQFSIHDKTHEIMVKVIDQESGEVIREIPPEKVLDAVAKMWELAGIIVDEKA